jgi:hypothetical protein
MAAPKPATVAELVERNKYYSLLHPINQGPQANNIIRAFASTHEPIPTFAELGAMGIDAPHTVIGAYLRASFPSVPPLTVNSDLR